MIPPIPTEPVSPKPMARPCSPAPGRQLAGGQAASAHTVRRVAIDLDRLQVADRSSTMPPSVVLWPAPLWPPLADRELEPVVAGEVDGQGRVRRVRWTDDQGWPSVAGAET